MFYQAHPGTKVKIRKIPTGTRYPWYMMCPCGIQCKCATWEIARYETIQHLIIGHAIRI